MRIACINHQPVSLYKNQGWSDERLAQYYNPCNVAKRCLVLAFKEEKPWSPSSSVDVESFRTAEDVHNKLKKFRPDVIRCYDVNEPFSDIVLDTANGLGIPSYLSLHNSWKLVPIKLFGYTVITAYTETFAKAVWLHLGREVEIQRNGVDSRFFDSKNCSMREIHHFAIHTTIQFGHPDWIVFSVGRNDPVKNIDRIVLAVEAFRKKTSVDVAFVVAGPGLERGHFGHPWAYEIGMTSQKNIRNMLFMSDCFFQVQLVPEISMACIEALMMRVPVINAANCETSGILKWPIGLTTSVVDDHESMADTMEFLWHNRKAATEAGKLRRRTAMDLFDSAIVRRQEADRYIKLCANNLKI